MVAAFRERFPGVPIERNTVESSAFFNRPFSGVLAWGLLFLLDPAAQALVIQKVAYALEPHGRFLFTAPREPLEWLDGMTERRSQSLGKRTYERLLREAGLAWIADDLDEGENHYYFCREEVSHISKGVVWAQYRQDVIIRCAESNDMKKMGLTLHLKDQRINLWVTVQAKTSAGVIQALEIVVGASGAKANLLSPIPVSSAQPPWPGAV